MLISLKILEGGNGDDAQALAAIKPVLLAVVSAWEPEYASAVSKRYGQLIHLASDAAHFVHGTGQLISPPGRPRSRLPRLVRRDA